MAAFIVVPWHLLFVLDFGNKGYIFIMLSLSNVVLNVILRCFDGLLCVSCKTWVLVVRRRKRKGQLPGDRLYIFGISRNVTLLNFDIDWESGIANFVSLYNQRIIKHVLVLVGNTSIFWVILPFNGKFF